MGNSQSSGGGGSGKNNNYNNGYLKSSDSSKFQLVTIKPESFTSNSISISSNTTGTLPNTNNQSTSSSNWGNSTINSGYSGGVSYSSQETHIQQVNTALGGSVMGGAYHDKRQERDVFGDGINYQVKNMANNLNYYGFKDPKGIVLSDCALEDKDIGVLVQSLQPHPFNLTILDLSNNKLGYYSIENIFYGMRGSQEGVTTHICKQIRSINFSNNLLDDNCANYIAKSLEYGRFASLKYLDVSGNNISATGHLFFAQALEHTNTPNMLIALKTTIQNVGEKANKALKETYDFAAVALKYTITQHIKNSQDTKWNINKVRTNQEIDKWQGCKDTVSNVILAYVAGVMKHSDLNRYAFVAAIPDGIAGLLDPDTLYCVAEINKSFEDVSLSGDCTIF